MKITINLTRHQVDEFKKFMHAKYLCGDIKPDINALDGVGVIVIREIAKLEREAEQLDGRGEA